MDQKEFNRIASILLLMIFPFVVCGMVCMASVNTTPDKGDPVETIYITYARVEIFTDGMVQVQYYKDGKFGAFIAPADKINIERILPGENPRIELRHYEDGTIVYELFIEGKEEI